MEGDQVIITEDGIDYYCDDCPGILCGEKLIAEFESKYCIDKDQRRIVKKKFLVECFQDIEAMTQTYQAFSNQEDLDKAWEVYGFVIQSMD